MMVAMSDPGADARVLEACRQGDREALRLLFEAYKDRVYSLALHHTRDDAAASDIVQEVFLRLSTRLEQFRGEARFGTWLWRLVVNACLDERRRLRRLVPFDASGDGHRAGGWRRVGPQEATLASRQMREAVQEAVARLSPRLRLPILLRYLEDLSYDEIAAVLGCTKGTVASRLNRGHRALARRLRRLRGSLP
jgi:RNA polymerase sigma-70 factor, ECF subfamily